MDLKVCDVLDQRFAEGPPGLSLLGCVDDTATLLETCFAHAVHRLLLHSENLTAHFFDLGSGEAGAILQKLRNYHIRFAIEPTWMC